MNLVIGWKRMAPFTEPPGKRITEEITEEHIWREIWNRRLQEPHTEQFKAKVNTYIDEGLSSGETFPRAADDELMYLRKRL